MFKKLKTYKKNFEVSYTYGAFATIELINRRPEIVQCIYIHPDYSKKDDLKTLCDKTGIFCAESEKVFLVNPKENCYVLGVFNKYDDKLSPDNPHVVLINPSDMGNLGTIVRTIAGMNIKDLAIVEPAADIWNPKTVRASMGALFHIRHHSFENFGAYRQQYNAHHLFPFMLTGAVPVEEVTDCSLFSLIFGNEASGLDESFSRVGQSVKIPLSNVVDSFNLSVAVGIGAYTFAKRAKLI